MKLFKVLSVSLLLAAALSDCSNAGTLKVSCTAPTQGNDAATCTDSPVLTPVIPGTAVVVHFAWTGASSGEDSVATTSGQSVSITKSVSPGSYTVQAWASWANAEAGCRTSVTVAVLPKRPANVGSLSKS